MSLTDQINEDLKKAMKNKEKEKMRTLRSIKNELLKAATEKGKDEGVSEEKELKILQKMAKQRKESIEIYEKQGRDDLLEEEQSELKLIENYLPEQLDESEIKEKVQKIIQDQGAESMEDMGPVMGEAMKQLGGKAEGEKVSKVVKSLLN